MNTSIIDTLINSGALVGVFAWIYLKSVLPLIRQQIAKQKASKLKVIESLLADQSETIVKGLSVNTGATGADKKEEAVRQLIALAQDKDIPLTHEQANNHIEGAYQGFAQTNAPALSNAQSAYEQQSASAAAQLSAAQSADSSAAESVATSAPAGLNPNNVGSNASQAPVSPLTSNAPESGATTNGQSVQ